MLVTDNPARGDVVRGIVGAISTAIVLALLYEGNVRWLVPKLLVFSAVSLVCVVTARSKGGVALGIAAIVVVRLALSILSSFGG